jgi:anti-sigma regulatory factor (Ser/Thr protein kinase)
MQELSLHILDIAENSIAAGARRIRITLREDPGADLLVLEITDDGRGMGPEEVRRAVDPFYTTRTTRRVGLGLALLKQAAREAGGDLEIRSRQGHGTTIVATFGLGHIDRKPIGALADTVAALLAAAGQADIRFEHFRDGKTVVFDTLEARAQLGDVPLDSAVALRFVREYLRQEERS